ncbi:uncharacterized protein MICPUCDRAFT_54921 [Micromonas pusilla CCMP1545]|uniref:Predicted protein n=1 Tax=Micromonas pusilla (strain CCMP1545) TaxID=564608 RepID=C1NAI3_MICPC|nr:uncharacterized protein MICPUCDRAFT_54921 [Micromonas pusilla CCMP1545]EEH50946.1 predicted protein [Micromonas pusilla CCMP1545]|eukprot:XP_003064966.1 predicted protein [Micromonas pusilla CCMP1545]
MTDDVNDLNKLNDTSGRLKRTMTRALNFPTLPSRRRRGSRPPAVPQPRARERPHLQTARQRDATHPIPPTRAMSDDLVRRRGTSGRTRTVSSPRACGSTLTPPPASAVTRTRRRLPASPSAVARTQPLPIARRGRSRRTRERHDRGGRGSRRSCSARLRLRTVNVPPVSPCSERRLRGSGGFSAGVVDPYRAIAEVPSASTHWRGCHRSDRDGTNGVRRRSIAGDRGERRVAGHSVITYECLSTTPTPSGSAIISRPLPAVLDDEDAGNVAVARMEASHGLESAFRRLSAHGADLRAKATLLRARRRRRDLSTARHVPSQRSGGRPPPPPPPPPIASSCEAPRQLRTHDVPTTRPRGDARGARIHARMTSASGGGGRRTFTCRVRERVTTSQSSCTRSARERRCAWWRAGRRPTSTAPAPA